MKYLSFLVLVLFYACDNPDSGNIESRLPSDSIAVESNHNPQITDTAVYEKGSSDKGDPRNLPESSNMDNLKEHKSVDSAYLTSPAIDTATPLTNRAEK